MSRYRTHLKEQSSERTSEYKGIQITGGWIIRYISLASTQVRDHDMCSTMMDLKSTLYNIHCIAFADPPTSSPLSIVSSPLLTDATLFSILKKLTQLTKLKEHRAHKHAKHKKRRDAQKCRPCCHLVRHQCGIIWSTIHGHVQANDWFCKRYKKHK